MVCKEVLVQDREDDALEGNGGASEGGGFRSCVLDFGRKRRDMKPGLSDCDSAITV